MTDTDPSDLAPESAEPTTQLDRIEKHLLRLHSKLHVIEDEISEVKVEIDNIKRRLDVSEDEDLEQKRDIGLICSSVKALCLAAGASAKAMQLTERIAERFPGSRGTLAGVTMPSVDTRDEPTNPGE